MTDIELLNFSKCNLLDYSEARPEYLSAYYTAKVILLRRAGELPITKALIISTFEKEYQTFFIGKDKDKMYWAGIKASRRFITKLFWLLSKYDVLQPIQTYSFIGSDGKEITGEYAIIQKHSETEKPLILMFHYNRPLYYEYPDISMIVKWLHSKNNYLDTGIYHFAMFRGESWKSLTLDYSLLNDWLCAILLQSNNKKTYVSPGSHCNDCKSKKCLQGLINV
jgi:hypothetical protein